MLPESRIHFIAIGGAAMHNIALDLVAQGHIVSGSDDEIYEPSKTRLSEVGILPEAFGWFPDKITEDLDFIILGMHARVDNPELVRARQLGLKVYSYPEFVFEMSKNKKRVVIAGSHGKTTTTAMICHVLRKLNMDFDYLLGAQIDGFDRMVKISNNELLIIEGDEYLSSPIDLVPKIHHYYPHIAVITGIAWDHINVFPTFENYVKQFSIFVDRIELGGCLIYYEGDVELSKIAVAENRVEKVAYNGLKRINKESVVEHSNTSYPISIIGSHNLQNMDAARLVCEQLGIPTNDFFDAIRDFTGANKRLQVLHKNDRRVIYLDFAHAPSKVDATTQAVKEWYGSQPLLAVLELHTYSSLNPEFLPQYASTLDKADIAIVYYNEHTIAMKKMQPLDKVTVKEAFKRADLIVITDNQELKKIISQSNYADYNILLMTSGNFTGMSYDFED